MAPNELIDRYIYAATKRINKRKMRDDIALELRTLIDDMLTERCGDALITEKDVRIVLTEIGTPFEVYRKYNPSSDKALISGEYYDTYTYIMSIVMACVCGGLLVAYFIMLVLGNFESPLDFILKFLTGTLSSVCGVFTSFTIIFAVLQRKNVNLIMIENELDFNSLQPVPKKSETISKAESIFGIVMTVLFTVILLFAPQLIGIIGFGEGAISIFDIEKLHSMWFIILAFGAVGVFDQCLRLVERQYTLKVFLSTLITNALSVVFGFILFLPQSIVNLSFVEKMQSIFSDNSFLINGASKVNLVLLGIIVFAVIIDTVEEAYHFIKHKIQ